MAAYTFQRILKDPETFEKSSRHIWINKNISFLKILFPIASLGVIIALFYLPFKIFYFIIPTAAISLFYAGNFLSYLGIKTPNLRSIPHLKIYLIAISWAITSGILPFFLVGETLQLNSLKMGLFIFLFILGVTIPFDIRDLQVDQKSKKTFPQLIGVKAAKVLSILLLLGSQIIGYLYFQFHIYSTISYGIILLLVFFSHQEKGDLYFTGLIDGMIAIHAGAIILDQICF